MTYNNVNLIYFSATGTTQKIVTTVAKGMNIDSSKHYNITKGIDEVVNIPADNVAVFGMPVYAGRIPQIMVESLNKFTGNDTPAIMVCAYGNREFDDALLELKDIVEKNRFKVISAGAFIAEHSIFPKIAQARPDDNDLALISEFGCKSIEILKNKDISQLSETRVSGNHPYRDTSPIPFKMKTSKECNSCGLCAKECPTQAISKESPKKVDKTKCILCAHCIAICPKKAKHFGGILYSIVSKKFIKNYSERKEPYTVYAK